MLYCGTTIAFVTVMKSTFFILIISIAIVSLLPFSTSSQPMSPGIENLQQQPRVLAALVTKEIASSPALPDLSPKRDQTQHDTPLEPGTILLFGTGLIALSFQWKYSGGNW
jgi:hypothetical protein